MKTSIGKYAPETNSVPVVFEHEGITHARDVKACLKEDGSFDSKATKARVAEVANGVIVKIGAGALAEQQTAPPEE